MKRDSRHNDDDRKPSTPGTLLFILLGPLIWAAHFTLSYGSHTLLCRLEAQAATTTLFVTATSLVAVALLSWFLIKPDAFSRSLGIADRKEHAQPLKMIAMLLAGLSIMAVLWGGLTVSFLSACVQGR
ncbi:hypothetical protein AB2N04_01780 [Nitratireductor sp. GISD-1A_MAKvit]|uniref:hypothetical protein n=1 Tax=Nitratireductor sp. GISD-1A_MAKvit TaxID=3234198 RepID=UPI0034677313